MTNRIDFILSHAIACGMLAPSRFGTRPWPLKSSGRSIELRLDRDRVLPVVDPVARELVMSGTTSGDPAPVPPPPREAQVCARPTGQCHERPP